MCGIIGGIAQRSVVPILLEGLRRLEYRGYDSAGIAVVQHGQEVHRVRRIGRVAELAAAAKAAGITGHLGIAHTRWATHGAPSEANAHPHTSHGSVAVVHNGIVENHEDLRARLTQMGYVFSSQTDTEVIAHLIHACHARSGNLLQAVQDAVAELKGTYAIAVMCAEHPGRLLAARKGSPLLIGIGIEEHFVASDVAALLPVTQRVVYLEDGDVADIGLLQFQVYDRNGILAERAAQTSNVRIEQAELGRYRHFMQKEIHEQPHALAKTLQGVLAAGRLDAAAIFGPRAAECFAGITRVYIVACGTSFHAGVVARYWLEDLAGIPCTVEVASEYRYRNSVPDPSALIVTISQSGETADTVAALQHAKAVGHPHTLTICNVAESALVRMSDLCFLTQAGPEIGVASTKAFTTQLAALLVLSLVLAKQRGRLTPEQEAINIAELGCLPGQASQALALEPEIERWAEALAGKAHALFLGRGAHYPIAMEGALKLKEISYIHAEAYPAGELKHGPLALVDSDMPVITIAPNNALLEKLKSNLQEVRARDGEPFVVADQETEIADNGIRVIRMPAHAKMLSPVLHSIPLQLLAYHVALQKGTDVDKPRNLAKSVTVE